MTNLTKIQEHNSTTDFMIFFSYCLLARSLFLYVFFSFSSEWECKGISLKKKLFFLWWWLYGITFTIIRLWYNNLYMARNKVNWPLSFQIKGPVKGQISILFRLRAFFVLYNFRFSQKKVHFSDYQEKQIFISKLKHSSLL